MNSVAVRGVPPSPGHSSRGHSDGCKIFPIPGSNETCHHFRHGTLARASDLLPPSSAAIAEKGPCVNVLNVLNALSTAGPTYLAQSVQAGPPAPADDRGLLMSVLVWLLVGLVAGFLASKLVNKRGEGIVRDILLGLVGSLV